MRIGFRHCDPRYPPLWQVPWQPAARWHAEGAGPANYFADTPLGAWAELLRHEGITDVADLAGLRRSLWAMELPDDGYAEPALDDAVLFGGQISYARCQQEAARLRAAGATRLQTRGAALLPGCAAGWVADGGAAQPRDGRVMVIFGACDASGWVCVEGGQPPPQLIGLVRPL